MIDASLPAAGDDRLAELRDAVEALGGQADRRAAEIEELRRLPADLSSALVDTGLGRAWAPARYGGLELPVLEVLDALEALAKQYAHLNRATGHRRIAWPVTRARRAARAPAARARRSAPAPRRDRGRCRRARSTGRPGAGAAPRSPRRAGPPGRRAPRRRRAARPPGRRRPRREASITRRFSRSSTGCGRTWGSRRRSAPSAPSRSMPATLARVATQARTSANSSRCWSTVPLRSAWASSPTSSANQATAAGRPRSRSREPYVRSIRSCSSARCMAGG